jgi:hypothetical protein
VKERERMRRALQRTGGRFGPVRGFVIPTLRAIGLFSERIEGHFQEMFNANFGAMAPISEDPRDLPEDLEAWVEEGGGIGV